MFRDPGGIEALVFDPADKLDASSVLLMEGSVAAGWELAGEQTDTDL
jgi:hypothetical protein